MTRFAGFLVFAATYAALAVLLPPKNGWYTVIEVGISITAGCIAIRYKKPLLDSAWDWDKINSVGKTKALQSSYAFLIIVPVLAKVLADLPPTMAIPLSVPGNPNASVTIHLRLPFGWTLLFWCALCVSVGNIIYQIRCPEIVKKFAGFDDFKHAGAGAPYLERRAREASRFGVEHVASKKPEDSCKPVWQVLWDISLNWSLPLSESIVAELSKCGEISGPTFHFVREAFRRTYPKWRLIATVFYYLGFFFLAIITATNIWFVLQSLELLPDWLLRMVEIISKQFETLGFRFIA